MSANAALQLSSGDGDEVAERYGLVCVIIFLSFRECVPRVLTVAVHVNVGIILVVPLILAAFPTGLISTAHRKVDALC
jgi:hypothetical protein